VILINLLPHRAVARKKRQDVLNLSLALSALIGGLISGVIFLWYQGQIDSQQDQNFILEKEIRLLDGQIKDIAGLEAEITALRARQQAVENLQADRNLPVHLLTELVNQLPDGVYISSMKQDNQTVMLQGVAQSSERVSELLRNLSTNTPWFTKPELIEIVAGSITLGARDQRRVANFNIRVHLVRSSELQKTTQGVGGTAGIPSPVNK
jgi:type IV pilus assembly protein PilN